MSTKQRDIQSLSFAFGDAENHGDTGLVSFITGPGYNTWYRYVYDNSLTVDAPNVINGRFAAGGGRWQVVTAGDKEIPAWAADTTYAPGDLIKFGGLTYIVTTGHTSNTDTRPNENGAQHMSLFKQRVVTTRLDFGARLEAMTKFTPDGEDENYDPIPGVVATDLVNLPAIAFQILRDNGFRFIYNGILDVTDMSTFTNSWHIEIPFVIESGDYLEFVAPIAGDGDITVTPGSTPTDPEVVAVSAPFDIDASNKSKIIDMASGAVPTVKTGGTQGSTWTIVNRSGGTVPIVLESGMSAVGDVNVANNAAVSLILLDATTVLISGGIA